MESADLAAHANKIERLRQIDPQKMLTERLRQMICAVKDGQLTVEDIAKYTNIPGEEWKTLIDTYDRSKEQLA